MVAEQLYTEERELKDIVQDILSEMGITKAELAERLSEMGEVRYTRSTISKYLSGKYDSNPEGIEAVLWEFVHSVEGDEKNSVTGLRSKTEYFESADFVNTLGICRSCQEDMALGIVVAKSGYGKTHSLKKYAKMPRVAYIECDDTMACRDLVEAIEKEIGMPQGAGGTIWSRVNRIRDFFNTNEGYLLIIDEADKLINKYTQKKMEIIRGIYDQADVGIVIAGEPRLEAEIKSNLVRFANRMDFYYKLKGLTEQEVREYLEGYEIDEQAMNEFMLRARNNQTGCFRLLDRTLTNVLRLMKETGEKRITLKVMREASGMMML